MPPRKDAMAGVELVLKTTRKRSFKSESFDPEQIRSEINPFASKLPSVAVQDLMSPSGENTEPPSHEGFSTVDDYAAEVGRLWGKASHAFIDAGRRINDAKSNLAHGEFMELMERRLPFSIDIAERLMAVARSVDAGVYPAERLPPNWSVAHALVTLNDAERPKALEEGLVRPSVTRKEIAEFKRRMRGSETDDHRASARREMARILNRMERDRKRLEELQALLGAE